MKVRKNIIFLGRKKLALDCFNHIYKMSDVNIFDVRLDAITRVDNVDFIISVLYPKIIKQEILDKVKIVAVNLHPGPLPEYGGCYEAAHAIINEEKRFGATLHIMTKNVDQGDIIEKRYFEINDTITGKELREKATDLCFEIFKDNIRNILDNNFNTYPQDLKNSRTYSRDSLSNKEVDLGWPLKRIYNFVRALDFPPFEPAFIKHKDKKIYLRTSYR